MMLKKMLVTAGTAGILVAGTGLAAPAQAAPVFTGGLVNITIVDAVDVTVRDVNVAVAAALAVAANVCDVNVAVLVADFVDGGSATCTNTVDGTTATITQR